MKYLNIYSNKKIYILIIILGYIVVLINFPINKLSKNSKSDFTYFLPLDSSIGSSTVAFDLPIINQLHKNSNVLNALKTYILFDSNLISNNNQIYIKINNKIIPKEEMNFDCTIYLKTCAVHVPNDVITSKTSIEVSSNLFESGKETKTFIGLLMHLEK